MSWVERLGRTLRETVGVGEEGDCGAAVHNDRSTSISNNNVKTCKIADMVLVLIWIINILVVTLLPKSPCKSY